MELDSHSKAQKRSFCTSMLDMYDHAKVYNANIINFREHTRESEGKKQPFFSLGQDYIDQTEFHHSWCVFHYFTPHVLCCNCISTFIATQKGKEDRSITIGDVQC